MKVLPLKIYSGKFKLKQYKVRKIIIYKSLIILYHFYN